MLLTALLLAGCATTTAPMQIYRAHGTEPFWGVTIGGGRIVYSAPDQPGVNVAAPRPRPIANGYRYVTPAIRIEITHVRCNDGMGDRYYADTFLVYFPGGDRPLEGCGGATLPPDSLNDTGWGSPRSTVRRSPRPRITAFNSTTGGLAAKRAATVSQDPTQRQAER